MTRAQRHVDGGQTEIADAVTAPAPANPWAQVVEALAGQAGHAVPAGVGKLHKAKPRTAPAATLVPRRLAAGIRAGWKAAKP